VQCQDDSPHEAAGGARDDDCGGAHDDDCWAGYRGSQSYLQVWSQQWG